MTPLTLEAILFDGKAPIARRVSLAFDGDIARLGGATDATYSTKDLWVSPRIATAPRFIDLPDGGQLECPDDPRLDELPQRERAEGLVAYLERHTSVVVAALAGTVLFIVLFRLYGLPAVAERAAGRIPVAVEVELGNESLATLDGFVFEETSLVEEQARIRDDFAALTRGTPGAERFEIVFRSWYGGPNAFALPGGRIVVTDELVHMCTHEQLLAVLAHEAGHQVRRHALQKLLVEAGTSAVLFAVIGDLSSATVAISGTPSLLLGLQYSREVEAEADEFAVALLRAGGRSPGLFADALECLAKNTPSDGEEPSFISSHPGTPERVAKARAAASAR